MIRHLKYRFNILYVLVALLFLAAIPSNSVFAIAFPDAGWGIKDQAVFRNYIAANDILFVVEYDLTYASVPAEDPRLAFSAEVVRTTGATVEVLSTIPIYYYGHAFSTLYLTEAETDVFSPELDWNDSDLKIVITGNPVLFPVVQLGINRDERPLYYKRRKLYTSTKLL